VYVAYAASTGLISILALRTNIVRLTKGQERRVAWPVRLPAPACKQHVPE
jgi:hypothetical protein